MELRVATLEDADRVSNLICRLSAKYISNEFTPAGRETLLNSMTPTAIEEHIRSGFRYHLAEEKGQLIGAVGVRDNSHLYHLFVAESYQRQGVATGLWQLAMQACFDEGNPGEFTVNSSKYAQEAYKTMGFVPQSGPQDKNGVVFIPMKLTINRAP